MALVRMMSMPVHEIIHVLALVRDGWATARGPVRVIGFTNVHGVLRRGPKSLSGHRSVPV